MSMRGVLLLLLLFVVIGTSCRSEGEAMVRQAERESQYTAPRLRSQDFLDSRNNPDWGPSDPR
jgi:hypothetical protein